MTINSDKLMIRKMHPDFCMNIEIFQLLDKKNLKKNRVGDLENTGKK